MAQVTHHSGCMGMNIDPVQLIAMQGQFRHENAASISDFEEPGKTPVR
jgi:hypothetical protein